MTLAALVALGIWCGICQQERVPAVAPDSIPVALLRTLPTLTRRNGETLKAQLVVVLFHREATVADRTRAITAIGGCVVGGRRSMQGDGWYIVRVPTATTVDGVLSVVFALRSDPSVEVVGDYSTSAPAGPPDSVPAGLYSPSSVVEDPDLPGSRYVRDVVVILFRATSTQAERQTAVASISGTVIGGHRLFGVDGYYLVRVHGDTSIRSAKSAVAKLRTLPQVEEASLERVHPRTS